jgi:hypothetical protein
MSASGRRMASPWWGKTPESAGGKAPVEFTFELLDARGKPPAEMALSMGIQGYTAFVNSDGGVFAQLHRSGPVSMATPLKANPKDGARPDSAMKDMPGLSIHSGSLPKVVSPPYGVPSRAGIAFSGSWSTEREPKRARSIAKTHKEANAF